ncbi:MAG: polyprenyl synthetase family protein [Ruminococcaceae bacterium]|nr:polyprenyl synthetase family protein [Oscillospiraceae bacterium]
MLLDRIKQNSDRVEAALSAYSSGEDEDIGLIFRAQRYSLLGGGKRIRPFIVNEVCASLGGDEKASMPLACAIEMIHTYSLIHDDLPCMDDDDMRRGKPSNHIEFGYANALLAGDALLTKAFATAVGTDMLDAGQKAEAVRLLADAAGERGMIGGQIMDLAGEEQSYEFSKLLRLHSLKTGALIVCSARLGCIAAGYGTDSVESQKLSVYAAKIGLAFQVVDDVLDVTADEQQLGKSVRSDADNNKTTFLSFYTVDEAKEYARTLTNQAIEALEGLQNCDTLAELARYLLERTN